MNANEVFERFASPYDADFKQIQRRREQNELSGSDDGQPSGDGASRERESCGHASN